MQALRAIDEWGAEVAAAGVVRADGVVAVHGPRDVPVRWASVTKLLTGLAALVAVEEGIVELDERLRRLLSHAGERRRQYSNEGIEQAAELVAAGAEMPFADYFREAVVEPLGLRGSLHGSPASEYVGPLDDLLALGRELLAPRLVAPETLAEATTVQFPGLVGVLPGFGRQEPNDWGLAFELRDGKSPHWTGAENSPRTFGHFGQTGTFLWVDPELAAACGVLTNKDFGDWAALAWPRFSDSVVREQRA
ncbi:MAG TPA: serine hydrolase domain-containing protein [Gaiellaceae bacterium]